MVRSNTSVRERYLDLTGGFSSLENKVKKFFQKEIKEGVPGPFDKIIVEVTHSRKITSAKIISLLNDYGVCYGKTSYPPDREWQFTLAYLEDEDVKNFVERETKNFSNPATRVCGYLANKYQDMHLRRTNNKKTACCCIGKVKMSSPFEKEAPA